MRSLAVVSLCSYDLEVAYAKGLRKNSEAFQKLAGRSKGYAAMCRAGDHGFAFHTCRSLTQALGVIATQTNTESEAHSVLANTLQNKIALPMKNLADTQLKARKPVRRVPLVVLCTMLVVRFRSKMRSLPSSKFGKTRRRSITKLAIISS